MDLRNLLPLYYDFYIVAREGNITQASLIYHIAQPTLSKNIRLLEEEIKIPLFSRTNKGVELTLEGEKLYKRLDSIFCSFCCNDQEVSDEETEGSLIVGVTRNVVDSYLGKYLSLFHQKFPKVKIIIDMNSPEMLKHLLSTHKIDILIDYLPNADYFAGSDLIVKTFGKFDTCFACSKDFFNSHDLSNITVKDLTNYDLVLPGPSRRRQFLDDYLQERNLVLQSQVEFQDWKFALEFVLRSDSIGYFIKEEIDKTELVPINVHSELPKVCFGFIYSKNSFNPITSKFIQLISNLSDIDF
ncbi:MAG: LysR family transcriptional regulator [Bacilli bacterium]|nr:LysR family transcriptional regulator [Bacilli bacterium]